MYRRTAGIIHGSITVMQRDMVRRMTANYRRTWNFVARGAFNFHLQKQRLILKSIPPIHLVDVAQYQERDRFDNYPATITFHIIPYGDYTCMFLVAEFRRSGA